MNHQNELEKTPLLCFPILYHSLAHWFKLHLYLSHILCDLSKMDSLIRAALFLLSQSVLLNTQPDSTLESPTILVKFLLLTCLRFSFENLVPDCFYSIISHPGKTDLTKLISFVPVLWSSLQFHVKSTWIVICTTNVLSNSIPFFLFSH